MTIAPFVAQHVAEVVHGNWGEIYLDDVINDVSYDEAVNLPPGITNSIAMLVNHIGLYNKVVIGRIKGESIPVGSANGFDVVVNNDEDWQKLRSATINSFATLAGSIKELPEERLWEQLPASETTFYKTFHGISEHAHYHLGQIVILKRIIRHAKNNG